MSARALTAEQSEALLNLFEEQLTQALRVAPAEAEYVVSKLRFEDDESDPVGSELIAERIAFAQAGPPRGATC